MKTFILSLAFSISVFSATAQSYDSLDINNIHAGFNAAGDLFYNINTGNGHLTTPGNTILYSVGNLWIGGLDAGSQLHIAAQTYRQTGTDFWPGPLDTTTIVCDTATSHQYNKVWKLNCADVDSFVAYTQGIGPPGYTVPLDIQTWPGNGNASLAYPHYIGPFADVDGDGYYNWTVGDYPIVRGNQSLFYVYNESLTGNTHSETGGQRMGIEIQAMPYAFAYPWDDALMNTVFIHYTIIYRNPSTFLDMVRVGFWSDVDFASGISKMGSDSAMGAYYTYDSTNAVGMIFLNQQMSGCMGYDNNNSIMGNPFGDQQYYNYLRQEWTDGTPLTVGGNGYGGTAQTSWMYNGDPTNNTGWNDNSAGDKRMLGTTGNLYLSPGAVYSFDVAMVFASDSSSTFSSVALLKQYMQQVKSFYQGQSPICTPGLTSVAENNSTNEIEIFPNPASSQITLHTAASQPQPYFIYDVAGQLLQTGMTSGNKTALDISTLPAGMYFLRVGKEEKMQTLKFVKSSQ